MGEVVAIWLKRFKGGPMDRVAEAKAIAGSGLEGNANQGGRRQVTLLDESRWDEAVAELGIAVDPSARRANVMLRGIDLEQSSGRVLRIGECLVLIHNFTRPCEQMDDAQPGLRAALSSRWRGGAYGELLEGGEIRVGDPAEWAEANDASDGQVDGA